jgi:hypothetical protein
MLIKGVSTKKDAKKIYDEIMDLINQVNWL